MKTNFIEKIKFNGMDFENVIIFHKIKRKNVADKLNLSGTMITQYIKNQRNIPPYRKLQIIENFIKPIPDKINVDGNSNKAMLWVHNLEFVCNVADIFINKNYLIDPFSYFYFLASYNRLDPFPNFESLKFDEIMLNFIQLHNRIHNQFMEMPITFHDDNYPDKKIEKTIIFDKNKHLDYVNGSNGKHWNNNLSDKQNKNYQNICKRWLEGYWWYFSNECFDIFPRGEMKLISRGHYYGE